MDNDILFIDKLKTKPYLYSKHSKKGRNVRFQSKEWRCLAQSLGKEGTPNELESWARKKWNLLKCRYIIERNKSKSGEGCQSSKSSWKYYKKMLYFDKFIPKRKSYKKKNENGTDGDCNTLIKSENIPICKVEKISQDEINEDSLTNNNEKSESSAEAHNNNSTLTLYLSEDEDLPLEFENETIPTKPMNWNCVNPIMDSISHFVNFMGDELKSLPSEKRRFVQFEIHKLLMEARSDTLFVT